jgi:tetratricopeptide (TPR) repeat protein
MAHSLFWRDLNERRSDFSARAEVRFNRNLDKIKMSTDPLGEAATLLDKGLVTEALAILKNESAEDRQVLYLLGIAHFRLKDYARAEDSLRRAILRDASRADCFYYLGLCAERQGRHDEARKNYQTALALNPNLKQAREKVEQLSGIETAQSPARKAPESELFLPRDDAEFDNYEQRRRRKDKIDALAQRDAGWNATLDTLSRVGNFLDRTLVRPDALHVHDFAEIHIDLSRGDAQLIVRHLSKGSGSWEAWLRELATSVLK